ncbi:hypothetical protein WR25_00546 [Diploscapter pachys]|uniref:Nematode cuticle collagen N-terminal domain-containing protein n=1 Tax=Diploscapter pachys TaxID=2018661 RepID=A0A2A2JJX8_9BILA|nr:hypothetical protein WR25_00546 [Diploscapter pachys]
MSARVLVAGATGVAGVAILVCIGCVVYLFNDVNNTFDHVMDEMKEFKHYSNNAWGQMTDITVFGKNSIFGRVKRGGGGCACGGQSGNRGQNGNAAADNGGNGGGLDGPQVRPYSFKKETNVFIFRAHQDHREPHPSPTLSDNQDPQVHKVMLASPDDPEPQAPVLVSSLDDPDPLDLGQPGQSSYASAMGPPGPLASQDTTRTTAHAQAEEVAAVEITLLLALLLTTVAMPDTASE